MTYIYDYLSCKQQPHQRPLTRYLPIRSESLNLRQHIESAGHQIELCPHVSLDSTSCRGYLHKMGSKFHNWNKRWFVFDRIRRTLTYYSDRGEKKPRGGAYFQVNWPRNSYSRDSFTTISERYSMDGGNDDTWDFQLSEYCCIPLQPTLLPEHKVFSASRGFRY
jgi:hypothetical protein